MNGIEMMMKSMGIDPEKLKQTLVDAQSLIMGEVQKVHGELTTINARLQRIELKLETIPTDEAMALLADGKDGAEKEVADYVGHYNGNDNN